MTATDQPSVLPSSSTEMRSGAVFGCVFFVGVLPALFVLWVQQAVEEPRVWREQRAGRAGAAAVRFSDLFHGPLGRTTFFVIAMNARVLFGWWGLNTWVPVFITPPPFA